MVSDAKSLTTAFWLALVSVLYGMCSGCTKAPDDLAATLGDFRYIGLQPSITMTVLKREVIKPATDYGHPQLRLTGVMKQEGAFPVSTYRVTVNVQAFIGEAEHGSAPVFATMENGTGAFSADIYLGDLGKSADVHAGDFRLAVIEYGWSPKSRSIDRIKIVEQSSSAFQ